MRWPQLVLILSLLVSEPSLAQVQTVLAGGFASINSPDVLMVQLPRSRCIISNLTSGALSPSVNGLTLSSLESGGQAVRFSVDVGRGSGIGRYAVLSFTRPTRSAGPVVVGESLLNRIQLSDGSSGTFVTTGTPTPIDLNRSEVTQVTYDLTVTGTAPLEPGNYIYGSTVTCSR